MAKATKSTTTAAGTLALTEALLIVEARIHTISGVTSEGGEDGENAFTSRGVRYVKKSVLAPAFQYRQETIRVARSIGTRFLSSAWAVPVASGDSLLEKLGSVGQRVNKFRDDLANDWAKHLRDWEKEHPEIAPYKGKFPTADDVRRQIGLSVATFAISPKPITVKGIEDGVASELQDLPHRILGEVAQDVRDFWSATSTSATQKIREPLARIANKCSTLAFLGGRIGYVAGIVEDAIKALPPHGKIVDADFTMLAGLLTMLSDPAAVERTAATYPNLGAEEVFGVKNPTGNLFEVEHAESGMPEANVNPTELAPLVPPVPATAPEEAAWNW